MSSNTSIDWTKPIEYENGMEAQYTETRTLKSHQTLQGMVPGTYHVVDGNYYTDDGKHWAGFFSPVRNANLVDRAIKTLKAEGYTVDETTGVISPPNKKQEAREFLADLMRSMDYELLARSFLRGEVDHKIANAIKFLNKNKHRIPETFE